MLVDKSARIWAMRHDDQFMAAEMAGMRESLRSEAGARQVAAVGGVRLEGSDFARIINGVAVIPVKGMLMREMSRYFWSQEEILRDVALAQADSNVRACVLDFDTPGGLVAGLSDAAHGLRGMGPKPMRAFVGGMCASAGYHLAAACDEIVVGSGALVGSIGTVIEYMDLEPYFEKMGARMIRVVAEQSPNKRLDPESPEGKAELQAIVDAGGAQFVRDVAVFRGVSEADVLQNYGQGMAFAGDDALERGMVDRQGTLKDLIAEMAGRVNTTGGTVTAAKTPKNVQEDTQMDWATLTAKDLQANRPDLVAEIGSEAPAPKADKQAVDAAVAEALQIERARVAAIDELEAHGCDDLVAAARADGATTAGDLAIKILKAGKTAGSELLADRAAVDGQVAVAAAPQQDVAAAEDDDDPEALKAKWAKDATLRAEFTDFDSFAAYSRANSSGRVGIYSPKVH